MLILLVALPVLLIGGCASGTPVHRYSFSQVLMGVRADIAVYSESEAKAADAARDAFRAMSAMDDALSDYRLENELTAVCRSAGSGWTPVSATFGMVLERAIEIARGTHGAFDPTVGPMVALWRTARKQGRLPLDEELAAARGVTGFELVSTRRDGAGEYEVSLARQGMRLDFGGIGKGAAAQAAIDVLRRAGHGRALVSVAGDLAAGEAPPGKDGWSIALATRGGEVGAEFITIANKAVSTSGDTEQFVEIGGVRYSHIVDPRTGVGLVGAPIVTVITPHGATADAVATALCVVGSEGAGAMMEQFPGAECLVRSKERGDMLYESAGFPERLGR